VQHRARDWDRTTNQMTIPYPWLEDAILSLQNVARDLRLELQWLPNAPATNEQIDECERAIGLPLPPSLRVFLQLANGAMLAFGVRLKDGFDGGGCELKILSAEKIAEWTAFYKTDFVEREVEEPFCRWGGLIVIADCEDGNYCILDAEGAIEEYPVRYMEGETVPDVWREERLADSFEDWLKRAFDAIIKEQSYPMFWEHLKLDRQAEKR
jgi:hypothetical protein